MANLHVGKYFFLILKLTGFAETPIEYRNERNVSVFCYAKFYSFIFIQTITLIMIHVRQAFKKNNVFETWIDIVTKCS